MRQVWKAQINPRRSPDFVRDPGQPSKYEHGKVERARKFCFDEGWVGIGWGIGGLNRDLSDYKKYLDALDSVSKDKLGFSPKRAKGPCKTLAVRMQDGDFVWCRAVGEIYWLGKVTGPWTYKHGGDFDNFDLYQVRKCRWFRVGAGDLVPGPVKNAFAGRGQAISRISTESDAALLGTALIWKSKTDEMVELEVMPPSRFPLAAIGHDDLEDIAALYLQIELGWHVVPSTAKKSTGLTECVLRNISGARAYLQVKSGRQRFTLNDKDIPQGVDSFYIFYPTIESSDHSRKKNTKVININPEVLLAFIKRNVAIMPTFVKSLF